MNYDLYTEQLEDARTAIKEIENLLRWLCPLLGLDIDDVDLHDIRIKLEDVFQRDRQTQEVVRTAYKWLEWRDSPHTQYSYDVQFQMRTMLENNLEREVKKHLTLNK